MKKVSVILLRIVMLMVFAFPLFAVSPFSLPITTIIIDPGHGGNDPGALSANTLQLEEKSVVLDLSLRIKHELSVLIPQATVIMTREDDRFISLEDRARMARMTDPGVDGSSILVSIHANGSQYEEASGFEILMKHEQKQVVFFPDDIQDWQLVRYSGMSTSTLNKALNLENRRLARALQERIASQFPDSRNRGIKEQDVWILNASAIPSVLIEIGFITNTSESEYMADSGWLDMMARSIAEGIILYSNL